MNKTYTVPELDDIVEADETYARSYVQFLIPETEDQPWSAVLPYFAAERAYEKHVAGCVQCSEGTLWDECPEGTRLGHAAAEAMNDQDALAAQN